MHMVSHSFEEITFFFFYTFLVGTCKKPYVALIDGITMGGVSTLVLYLI